MEKEIIKITLVEDSETNVKLMKKWFSKITPENIEIELSTFPNGEDFIENSKKDPKHIDILITDYNMPKKNGLDVIKYCKEECIHKKETLIIVISGELGEEIRKSCVMAGANLYIEKPFEPKDLQLNLKKIMNDILEKRNK